MKQFITAFLVCAALVGCKTGTQSEQSVMLSGDSIPYPEDFLASSVELFAADTFYFRSSGTYNNLVATLTGDNEIVTIDSLLKTGLGPGEILECSLFKGNDEKVYVMAKTASRPLIVNEVNLNVDPKEWRNIVSDSIQGYFMLGRNRNTIITPDSMILFAGGEYPELKGLFTLIDMKNGSIKSIDYFPDDGVNCAANTRGLVYINNSYLYGNNSGKYLYVLGVNKFSFLFHLENDKVVIDKWLFEEYPDYWQTDETGKFKWNPKKENLAVAATDKYIYMLMKNLDINGKDVDNYRDVINGRHIEVYDWEGNKVTSYDLDSCGYGILVDKEGKTLYLQQMNGTTGDFSLRKYKLPE